MSRQFKLSKSKLLAYRQCPKRLWLQTHRPELAEVDAATSAVMASGTAVGEVFRSLYPNGVLIDDDDLGDALDSTRTTLQTEPTRPIFEATFEANAVLVRVDMLAPSENGYQLVEVKSSTRVKDYHLDDAAIQTWVATQAGIPVTQTAIAHINNQFIYPGNKCYQGLFAEETIDEQVSERLPEVIHWVRDAQAMLAGNEPSIEAGDQCHDPFSCPFFDHCSTSHDGPEFPVELLPRSHRLAAALRAEGYDDLREVPDDRLDKATHQKVLRVTKSGQAELSDEGRQIARSLPYPRYYLDFETIAFAVPRWADTRPYQQVPFQFSCHIELAPGIVAPAAYLSTDGNDPRRPFAEALIAAVNSAALIDPGTNPRPTGPVLVYNAPFERSRITELAAHFPDLADELLEINERIVDLLPITREHYYHPEMRGSWSLKAVLPTIGAGLDYEGMAVANGGMAQDAYLEMIDPETTVDRKEELRQGLLDYCALDTYALLQLVEFFSKEP
jgi:hypothetical protein